MSPSTIEKEEASKFSEDEERHITIAMAVETCQNEKNAVVAAREELFLEMERFRAAMRGEARAREARLDREDLLFVLGVAVIATGIAVAFHWAYSLIMIGTVCVGFSLAPLVPFLRRPTKRA
jgi:hypothetical protein